MRLLEKINRLFEQLGDIEKMWGTYSKDLPMTGKPVLTYHQANPQYTYDIWFPLKTQEYKAKIRSRNPRSALLRLIYSFPEINYKGRVYTPNAYNGLFRLLVKNGDFRFTQGIPLNEEYTKAQDFAQEVLGIGIERPKQYKSQTVALTRYTNGTKTIRVPKQFNIDSPEVQRMIWHEIGHHYDQATYFGGRSSSRATITVGHYATPHKDLLLKYREYIQKDRKPPELSWHIKYKGKIYKNTAELYADPTVDDTYKVEIKMKEKQEIRRIESYLEQDIELFADGFAKYKADPQSMAQEAPELAKIYSQVWQEKELVGKIEESKDGAIISIVKELESVLANANIPMHNYKIFGSRRRGDFTEKSDVDIAITVSPEDRDRADALVGSMAWQDLIKTKYGIFPDIHVKSSTRLNEAISPFEFQDSNQEKIIHSDWNAASIRYDFEGAGDIFRELSKDYNDPGYIDEKIKRLERLIQGYETNTLHHDDTIENAKENDKEKMDKLLQLWKAQPTITPEQDIAKQMNIALITGNISEVKRLIQKIKNLKFDRTNFKLKLNEGKLSKEEQHFEERTRSHIALVQQAAKQIAEAFPEFAKLSDEVKDHDASKLKEPERTPYVSITWRHKLEQEKDEFDPINKKGYQPPGQLKKDDENKATLHHITTNSHHPEYWLADKSEANINSKNRDKSDHIVDATKMPPIALAEMVADWQAMAEELKKNTAREWYDQQKNKRWRFSGKQDKLISRILEVFENK